jgi:hypothetical protein
MHVIHYFTIHSEISRRRLPLETLAFIALLLLLIKPIQITGLSMHVKHYFTIESEISRRRLPLDTLTFIALLLLLIKPI